MNSPAPENSTKMESAEAVVDKIHSLVKSSQLNFSIRETPYSSYIVVRKSYIRTFSPLINHQPSVQLPETEKQLISAQIECNEQKEETKVLQKEKKNLAASNEILKNESITAKKDLANSRQTLDTLNKELSSVNNLNKTLNANLDTSKNKLDSAHNDLYDLRIKLSETNSLLKLKEKEMDTNEKEKRKNNESFETKILELEEFKKKKIDEEKKMKKIEKKQRKREVKEIEDDHIKDVNEKNSKKELDEKQDNEKEKENVDTMMTCELDNDNGEDCLLYTSPSPRDS